MNRNELGLGLGLDPIGSAKKTLLENRNVH